MANLRALLDRLEKEHPKHLKGKPFEKICIWWLKTDPTYAHTFKGIWQWYDWPDRLKKGFGNETGIDLVGETHTGNLWAIQVKCHLNTDVPLHVLTDFLSLSGSTDFAKLTKKTINKANKEKTK